MNEELTTVETETTPVTDKIANPFDSAIAIEVRQHRWGIRRKVRDVEAEVRTVNGKRVSADVVSMNKFLCKSREFDAILSLDNALRADLNSISVPAMLAESTYLVPLGKVTEARSIIKVYMQKRPILIEAFIDFYTTDMIPREKTRQGDLFRRDQYPAPGDVRDSFFVEVRYRSFGVPGELKSIDEAAYEEAVSGIRDEMQNATLQIRDAMRAGLQKLVSHLHERLLASQPNNGRPGKLYDSAVENLRQWLNLFECRNLTNDRQLKELVEQCKGIMEGTETEELRANVDLRAIVAEALDPINETLSTMISEAPVRVIELEDD